MMTTKQSVLSLRSVSLMDANTHALLLRDISLDVKGGELHAVVCTRIYDAVQLMDLFLLPAKQPVSGSILLNGKPYTRQTQPQIAFALGPNDLLMNMTVAQNLFVTDPAIFHCSHKKARERAERELDQLGIHLDVNKTMEELTSDEQQMVTILRAYFLQAPVVVFNNTLTQLSSDRVYDFMEVCRRLRKRNTAILYLTAKVDDALKIADSVSVLDNGTIKDTFTVDEIRKKPRSILYLLSGWDNLFRKAEQQNDEVLETLINAKELMTSSFELKTVLKYLADYSLKTLDASRCQIYIVDHAQHALLDVIDTQKSGQSSFQLSYALAANRIQQGQNFVWRDADISFPPEIAHGTIMGIPVSSKMEIRALVLVFFEAGHEPASKEHLYLSTFAKEISIAIETSELMGHSVLLQESHHRIKNSLQMIINLLYLQKTKFSDEWNPRIAESYDMIISRVKSIAAMHDLLARDNLGKNSISLAHIVQKIVSFYHLGNVDIELELDNMNVPYNKAVSMSMVINELVSNSVKHAFAQNTSSRIRIICQLRDPNLIITVRDNGVGYPEAFHPSASDSIGISIVNTVVRSLHGTIRYYNDHGAVAEMVLPQDAIASLQVN